MKEIEMMRNYIDGKKARSAWNRGVKEYAVLLLDHLEEAIESGYFFTDDLKAPRILEKGMLNGASDWNEYSWGGCALIYDGDIAKALCNQSELKKTDGGRKRPNAREQWLDVQARALFQAAVMVKEAAAAL